MLRTIGRLFVILLSFFAAVCIVALFPLLSPHTKWEAATNEVQNICDEVNDACILHGNVHIPASEINEWLAGELSPEHPLAKELRGHPRKTHGGTHIAVLGWSTRIEMNLVHWVSTPWDEMEYRQRMETMRMISIRGIRIHISGAFAMPECGGFWKTY